VRLHVRLCNTRSWYSPQARPASISSRTTVFLLAPVNRVTARIDCPSQSRWRMWARASRSSLFMPWRVPRHACAVKQKGQFILRGVFRLLVRAHDLYSLHIGWTPVIAKDVFAGGTLTEIFTVTPFRFRKILSRLCHFPTLVLHFGHLGPPSPWDGSIEPIISAFHRLIGNTTVREPDRKSTRL